MSRNRVVSIVLALLAVPAAVCVVAQDTGVDSWEGPPADTVEDTGVNELMWVAGHRPVGELRALIDARPGIDPVATDLYGNNALHYVAYFATDPASLDVVLDLGVPTGVINSQGFTPFEIIQGNTDLRGTDPYMRLLRAKLEARE